jgi:cytidyltransferase-like protein
MPRTAKIKLGIFLGRLQPQHKGHEFMIEKIFKENDEVVLCVGSAQKIEKDNPDFLRNPLSKNKRIKHLKKFLEEKDFQKPYKIVTAEDIEPDEAWPAYLKACCHLTDQTQNTIYFGNTISKSYEGDLKKLGFKIKFIIRKEFIYKTKKDNARYKISSSTEIRNLEGCADNL